MPGQGITYTITVTNDGPSDVTGASVVDDLPTMLTGATFNASASGGASGFTASGSGSIDDTDVDLPVGSAITYTVQANIASSATGTLSNTAAVTPPAGVVNTNDGNSDSDITPGGNHAAAEITDGSSVATDIDTLTPEADLEITKTDGLGGSSVTGKSGIAVPGQVITYTILVTNAGPSDVSGASVVDDLPSSLTGATYTAAPSGGATGYTASGSGSIDDTDVDMPAGSTITYTVLATISPSATGTLSNTATVTAPEGVTDTDTKNNSATDTDALTRLTGLEITKTDNLGGTSAGAIGTAVPGQAITYTIIVANAGPSAANGASIIDALPSALSGATFTAAATGGATGFTPTGSGSIDDADVDLPPGSTITYTLQATIAPSATGTLSNTATVTPPAGVINTDNGGSSATDTDTLTPEADLQITKTDNLGGSSETETVGTAVPGQAITYTVVVTNAGPSNVTGATVVDTLLSTLTDATYTATETGGATGFTTSGSGSIDDTDVNLPAGSTVTYTLRATIASSATGTLSNTASVVAPEGVTDTDTDNNSATDTDGLTPEADLEITKTDNLGGSSITGTSGTALAGHGITYTIVVTNAGPSNADGASVVDTLPSTLSGATFTAVETGGASGFATSGTGNIDDTDVDLPAGSTVTYTVQGTIVTSATGTLSNTATVAAPEGVTDSNLDNNSATDTDTLTPQVDLEIAKTDNLGGSSVTGTSGTAVPGEGITYTITVSNAGSADADGASVIDTLPSTLSGATFTATETGEASGFTASGTGSIDDTDVELPPGSTITYTVHATVSPSATGTLSNTATVAAPQGVTDSNPTNNSATDTDTLTPQVDLTITKTDNLGGSSVTATTGTAVPGEGITYTITVNNAGPSNATGASVIDTLPSTLSGATYTAVATGGASGFTASGSGSIDDTDVDLPAGSTVTYTIQANIASSATGTLSNTAKVTGPDGITDTDAENNSATDADTLTPEADLTITKTDNLGGSSITATTGTAVPGEGITYTIVVINFGPSDAPGASVADDLSSLLTGATYTATETGGASGFTASGSGSIDDTDVDLPAGSSVTYVLQATIAPAATGMLSNTATMTPPAGVTNTGGQTVGVADAVDRSSIALDTSGVLSSATDTDTLTPESELEVTKTDNLGGSSVTGATGSAVAGQGITYTIVVTNVGPSNATDATVHDTLPDTLTGATFTATETGGASGFTASGTGPVDDTALSMPVGSTITYIVHATIVPGATGSLSSTVTVSTPTGQINTGHSTATDADTLAASQSAPQTTNLGPIDFTVSALLTGNLTNTGNYLPPPTPHTGLPISQPFQPFTTFQSLPVGPFESLPAAAVDNLMTGASGGDVGLLGPQLDLDMTKVNQGPDPLWEMLTNSRREDWSSDELIGSLLEKLADVDELSLVSFEFGDDVVSPTPGKIRQVTTAKPVMLNDSNGASNSSNTRGASGTPDLNAPTQGGDATTGAGKTSGDGSNGETGTSQGSSTGPAPPDGSTQSQPHGWFWWAGWSVSAGSVGTLGWIYGRRRRNRGGWLRRLRSG